MATEADLIATMERGDALANEGKIAQALKAYAKVWDATKSTGLEPGSLANMAAYSIVDMYLSAGQPKKAVPWLERMLTLRPPKDTSNYVIAGQVWLALGDEAQALECFSKAFELGNRRAFQGRDPTYLAWYRERSGKTTKGRGPGRPRT